MFADVAVDEDSRPPGSVPVFHWPERGCPRIDPQESWFLNARKTFKKVAVS